MVPIVLLSIGSFVGILGMLVAYDPSPLCDFRDLDRPNSALDGRSRRLWRFVGLLTAVAGIAIALLAVVV